MKNKKSFFDFFEAIYIYNKRVVKKNKKSFKKSIAFFLKMSYNNIA